MLLFFVFIILVNSFSGADTSFGATRDVNELYSIILIFYSVVFVAFSKNGFHNGGSFFSMADVNLMFTSPVKSSSVLAFGLFQQLGKALTLGLFILYQTSLVCDTYSVEYSALVYILIGYSVVLLLSQMVAVIIYSFTSHNEKRKRIVKGIYVFVISAFAVLLLIKAANGGEISLVSLGKALRDKMFLLFPVSGVVSLFCEGAIAKESVKLVSGLTFSILSVVVLYLVIRFANTDYYEDVLKSAEISFSSITSRKEGKAQENAPMNVKVGKTGIGKGFGANVIAYKHKIENRRSKVLFLNMTSYVFIGLSTVYCFVLKDFPVGIFALNVYMMTISVGMSRFSKEFSFPYIYLIPESSFKKLLYMLKGEIPGMVIESICCFIPVHFILKQSVLLTFAMVLARVVFGFMFISVNLVLQRFFGSSDKKLFVGIVYLSLIALFSLPGIVVFFIFNMMLPFNNEIGYVLMSVINGVIALIAVYCSRNVLEYSEMNQR